VTPFVLTYILWGIIATTNPNVSNFMVLDEFPDRDDCMKIATETAVMAARQITALKVPDVTSITVVCIPAPAGRPDVVPNEKSKKHLRTEPIG